MNKKQTQVACISFAGLLLISAVVYFSVALYRSHKYKEIVKSTTEQLFITKNIIRLANTTIDETSFILLPSEKEKLIQDLSIIKDDSDVVEKDINQYTQLNDQQLVRAKLEEGFDVEAQSKGYKTPIRCLEELNARVDIVEKFCKDRNQIRNRAVKNEMLLKSILKKPISGIEIPQDLQKVSKHASELLKLIPKDDEHTRAALGKINEVNLRNSLGMLLYNSIPVLEDIKLVALEADIKTRADQMWSNAKENYVNVRTANDAITWYVPEKDDGSYDSSAYMKLLSAQSNALSFYENGNRFLTSLSEYRNEVRSQKLVYVLSNSYDNTTFRHSRRVSKTVLKRNANGDLRTVTEYETEYYRTQGRVFYYTVRTVTPNSHQDNRIKVGEKDSHSVLNSLGGWRDWNYRTDQQEGYLIEYKPFGYDNRRIVRGGTYNPNSHRINH